MAPDRLTLLINGRRYEGWQAVRVSHGIDRCVSDFHLEVSERWTGQETPWQILPYAVCQILIDDEVILTGYVEDYDPRIGPAEHSTQITGKSKTMDLLECTPDIPSGQFRGYPLAAIARSIAALFGIDVVVEAPDAETWTFDNAQFERCETAFTFLERLGRMAGVLLSDDAQGRLVLTTAGGTRAAGSLVEGQNIQRGSAKLTSKGRFSEYIVKGQHGVAKSGGQTWGGAGGVGGPSSPAAGAKVQTSMRVVAYDTDVPRYRPRVVLAESQLTLAGMQMRANWLRQAAFGHSVSADITVAGWRQADGSLWQRNQIIAVTSPTLGVDQDLLIARVEFALAAGTGRTTTLHVAPVQAYTPDPGQVKLHKHKGKGHGGNCPNWQGAGGQ